MGGGERSGSSPSTYYLLLPAQVPSISIQFLLFTPRHHHYILVVITSLALFMVAVMCLCPLHPAFFHSLKTMQLDQVHPSLIVTSPVIVISNIASHLRIPPQSSQGSRSRPPLSLAAPPPCQKKRGSGPSARVLKLFLLLLRKFLRQLRDITPFPFIHQPRPMTISKNFLPRPTYVSRKR